MKINDLTPKKYQCALLTCQGIYEITPDNEQCSVGVCPGIHYFEDNYLIVGEQVNPLDVGLEKKVGEGEILIKIKKEIIDNRKEI